MSPLKTQQRYIMKELTKKEINSIKKKALEDSYLKNINENKILEDEINKKYKFK